jgi:hypothetical protein
MIATFVMDWTWIELPIDLWIERQKILDRIDTNDKLSDGFWAMFDSLCITADEDNGSSILVSDYTEENQVNDWTRADFIELNPSAELHLPRNRQVSALNRPFVMGQAGDVVKVVAR